MDASDTDRLRRVEERVARLEAAVAGPSGAASAPAVHVAPSAPTTATASATATATAVPAGPSPTPPSIGTDPLWAPGAAVGANAAAAPRSLRDLEEQLSGRLLAWVGGIALVIGGAFFLTLAFSRGWIGPEARVVIGLVASAAAMVAGAWLFERRQGTPALVLTAVGVAVGTLALFAAAPLYNLIPTELALLGSLVIAIGAAAIAIRSNSVVVAALGLLTATLAPPIMGGPITTVSLVLIGATLVGTSLIAIYRPWALLPILAFLTTAPQLSVWLRDDASQAVGLLAIAAYWLVNAAGSTGATLRRPRPKIHLGAAVHLVLLGLYTLLATRLVLADEMPGARLVADALIALAYVVAAGLTVRRAGPRHPMVSLLLAIACGIAVIAVALELGGVARTMSWAALALVLGWAAVRLQRRDAAVGALTLAALVLADIVLFIYPLSSFGTIPYDGPDTPFASPEGIAVLAIALGVAAFSAWAWWSLGARRRVDGRPDQRPEVVAIAGGLLAVALISYAALFELRGLGVVVAWSAAAAAAFGIGRLLLRSPYALATGYAAGFVLALLATWEALATIAPLHRLAVDPATASAIVPFANGATAGLLAITASLVVGVAILTPDLWHVRTRLGMPTAWLAVGSVAAAAIATYAGSIGVVDVFAARVDAASPDAAREIAAQAQVALTIFWVVVGGIAFAFGVVRDQVPARGFGLAMLALATLKLFLVDLASVDAAYRVLSFIGVGAILLGLSFLSTKRRSRPTSPTDDATAST